MKISQFATAVVSATLLAMSAPTQASPRDAQWAAIGEAMKKDQPKTAIEALQAVGAAAATDQAWGEAAKATGLRLALNGRIEGGPQAAIKALDTELATAPEPMKPVLRALQANWFFSYYQQNRWRFARRSATAAAPGEDIETWDLSRILAEVDKRFQQALADKTALQALPVASFTEIFTKGELGDAFRPTVYDFIAHNALGFYQMEEVAVSKPEDAFEIAGSSPALGGMAEFLAWNPETHDADSLLLRALKIHQDLLRFHQNDADRTAFLHCDLERLRWAGATAVGPEAKTRLDAALRSFIEANAAHPLSADARHDVATALRAAKKNKEAHDFALVGAKAFPDHPFGKICRNVVIELETKHLGITLESQWTPAGSEIVVRYRNVSQIFFHAYAKSWNINAESINGDRLPDGEAAMRHLLKDTPATSWDAVLPDEGDFADREARLVAPEGLDPGYYWIVASADEGFAEKNNSLSVAGVMVTRLAMTVRPDRSGGGLEGIVTDAVTGTPVEGVQVTMAQDRNMLPGVHKEELRSGADGFFHFNPTKEHGTLLVVAEQDDHRAVVRTYGGTGQEPPAPGIEDSIVFFTDRALYRPGQTIQFKGIWCRTDEAKNDYQTVANTPVQVTLRDPNDKEIAKLDLATNERGSFAGTFTAPSGSVLGTFSIQSAHGSTRFNVEEYKRPKFLAEIKPPEAPAALGAPVTVLGKAIAYTGAAIDGAKVEWRVTRRPRWPIWIRWCWWFCPPAGEAKEIAHGTAVTGADGTFPITFTAEPDKSIDPATEPVFDFEISADVTDTTGETRSDECNVSVAYTTLRATLSANLWIEANSEAKIKIRTESHDGQARSAEGSLRVHKLKEPAVCPRPSIDEGRNFMPYAAADEEAADAPSNASSDPDKWELAEVVAEFPAATGEKGEVEIAVTLPPGLYRAAFVTKDANGREVKALLGLHAVQPDADKFAPRIPFYTGTPAEELQPGETFQLVWGSGFPEAHALLEWFKDGKMFRREWTAPGRTQQVFTQPIDESMRGGLRVKVTQLTMNSLQTSIREIKVPWKSKGLQVRWDHLTSKLAPGAKDTWTAVITGPGGEAAVAEMVATLYDASLDQFLPHVFGGFGNLFRHDPGIYVQDVFSAGMAPMRGYVGWDMPGGFGMGNPYREFIPELNVFGGRGMMLRGKMARGSGFGTGGAVPMVAEDAMPMAAMAAPAEARAAGEVMYSLAAPAAPGADITPPKPDLSQIAARKNLQETAFFFPQLVSNEAGEVRMAFTIPEALTKWRFLGFAHDAAMRSGHLEGETVTARDLMVQPNPPRFLREGDMLEFTVKITNTGAEEHAGAARLTLADAATQKDATALLGIAAPDQEFKIPAKASRTLSWRLTVPDGAGFLQYKAVAASGDQSDGEEGWLPVIPRRILVTESMALPIRNAGEKKFTFKKLLESGKSTTLQNQFVHVQVTSQPAWYAVMALPYLMEFPHECAEQTFNRYYANALARHIGNSDPKIARIFGQWKGTDALDSPLTKNADLKGILLEETPWLNEAKDESAARRRVGLLFDANHMDEQLGSALDKLAGMQHHDGLWPWFPGGQGSEYITLYITTGFGRLRHLGVETDISPALKALPALDRELQDYYNEIKKHKGYQKENHLTSWIAHHLYTRSFFLKDRAIGSGEKEAFDFFTGQAKKYWASLDNRMARAHVALALHRLGDEEVPKLITRSLKENAVDNEEMGMWWKDRAGDGWWWWRAPIETQAMMIEAFREINADAKAVEDCQVWLLKQKQVQDWRTTKATADAIYGLLLGGDNLLGSDALLEVALGGQTVKPDKVEPGTGFYEARFTGPEVKPEFGNITVRKSDAGVSWAGIHWQYLEDMAKVTEHNATPLKLQKSLFVRRNTPQGPKLEEVKGPVKVGDELVTRVVLRNDRAMEFIHLKDLRGSGTEPVNVLSGYRAQDGFGYYEVTRDTASHFFVDALPPGTHVFETSVRVQHAGAYQTGVAEIRCMYAPEFNAHSGSVLLQVEK